MTEASTSAGLLLATAMLIVLVLYSLQYSQIPIACVSSVDLVVIIIENYCYDGFLIRSKLNYLKNCKFLCTAS